METLAESSLRSDQALVQIEQLDPAKVDLMPAGISAEVLGDEFWFGGRVVRTRWALMWGNPHDVLDELRADRAARFTTLRADSLAATMITTCEADVLIALGRGSDAAQLLAGFASQHPAVRVRRGRLQLLAGRSQDALGELAPVFETTHPWVRARMEALTLAALAQQQRGQRERAIEGVRQAIATGQLAELVTPWALLGASAASPWAAEATGLASIFDELDAAGVRTARTTEVTVRLLSVREREVLSLLADGLSFEQVAQRRFVTRNTVKSQVRAIYRKLEVTSLPEAIAKAYQLGLVT